ncbi:TPA: hypothetical protein U5W59_002472 [Staphylococcus aureus]|nr:hypothetical protein [Staphylococcus aureus]HCV8136457.1 hypothetical protein [Staphylococcus aureus]HCV9415535.1 hypothetical protein [Staphylococcus aureus]HDI7125123.1 hypothetical protein [Staphylococcus aureus]HDI7127990.1 hypothetical protein [Staphylococcus aureus]
MRFYFTNLIKRKHQAEDRRKILIKRKHQAEDRRKILIKQKHQTKVR